MSKGKPYCEIIRSFFFISSDIIIRLSEIYTMKIYFVIKIFICKTKASCSGEGRGGEGQQ